MRPEQDVVIFYGAALLPEQENDQLLFGSRVALGLFAENYRPRGDLRRWTIIDRAESAGHRLFSQRGDVMAHGVDPRVLGTLRRNLTPAAATSVLSSG